MPARLQGALLIAAATLCWSTGGLIVRTVAVDAWTIVFIRSLFLALAIGLYLLVRHGRGAARPIRAMGWAGVISGLLVAASFLLFILAVTQTLVANALVIMSASPLVSAVLGRVVLGERLRPLTLWAIAAALGGIAVMFIGPSAEAVSTAPWLGNLFALGVALSFGANIVVVRRSRHVDMVPAMFLGGLFAAAVAAPFASPDQASARDVALLALMGVFQLGLGLFLFIRGTPHLGAAEVGLLTLLEAVFAPLWVWLAYAETPGPLALAGGGIVLAALGLHSLFGIRRSKPPTGMA